MTSIFIPFFSITHCIEHSTNHFKEDKLLEIVKKEVYLYTADQIGLPDYALASAGGFVENVEVISITSLNYH